MDHPVHSSEIVWFLGTCHADEFFQNRPHGEEMDEFGGLGCDGVEFDAMRRFIGRVR